MRLAFSTRRKSEGLTYDVVAERSGIARRTVQRLENGEREGNIKTWFHLANAVGIDLPRLSKSLYEIPIDAANRDETK
ncbi:helix-turn-helix transcriptional regulator [Frigoribacterium sp. ACAM 257]|uniref:helix-turn-helix transcriptional regulator n=1 Tax=Frigoribacterium sp. ACAM 257 TaxID=2508998 RepID=UPI0011B95EA6|nr:helix-turn-helix transcriptional regulator [Frigoribacterium sp. ACAM 257]